MSLTLEPAEAPHWPSAWAWLALTAVPPLKLGNSIGTSVLWPHLLPTRLRGRGLVMIKLSGKEDAKDVNEPVKSPVTAVTAVAPAIKHGALTAQKYTWGICSRACLTHVHIQAVHTCTLTQAQWAVQTGRGHTLKNGCLERGPRPFSTLCVPCGSPSSRSHSVFM